MALSPLLPAPTMGVTIQPRPFQNSATGVPAAANDAELDDPPIAQHAVADVHDTPDIVVYRAPPAIVLMVQLLPSQNSANGRRPFGLPSYPTAMQTLMLVQEMLSSTLFAYFPVAPLGAGTGKTVQLLPFQISTIVVSRFLMKPVCPTAQHAAAEVQETPSSSSCLGAALGSVGLGVGSIFQRGAATACATPTTARATVSAASPNRHEPSSIFLNNLCTREPPDELTAEIDWRATSPPHESTRKARVSTRA